MLLSSEVTVVSFPKLGLGPWNLDRFVFEDLFGFLSVAWYGLIICVAMILGCTVVVRNATKKEGFEFDSFLDYFIFCIPVAVVGARVMYVLSRIKLYNSFMEMIAIWNGGIAIYGAVIAGALTILVVAKVKKQNPMKVFDAMVPGLLLGQAIGRWGNFVNGEAFGTNTDLPWGMMVGTVGPVHPTFLYESLITFSGFLLAMLLVYRFKKWDGQVFAFYLVWYGIGRTLVEGLRTDSLMVGDLRLAQCIGILTALGGIILMVAMHLVRKNAPVPAEGEACEKAEVAEKPEGKAPAKKASAKKAAAKKDSEKKEPEKKEEESEDSEKKETEEKTEK